MRICGTYFLCTAILFITVHAWAAEHSVPEFKNDFPLFRQRGQARSALPPGTRLAVRPAYMTGYCGETNTPPGSDAISQPPFHARLGDGSFDNPTTLAVNPHPDRGHFFVLYGTRVFIPDMGWTVAEDLCGACMDDANRRLRIDLWLGMDATTQDEYDITGWYWVIIALPTEE